MTEVYIIGTGMIRFGNYPGRNVSDMAQEATYLALKDAKIEKKALQSVFFSNTFWGLYSNQHAIRGQVAMRKMGIDAIPVINVENACAGGATALHLAYTAIKADMHDVVLVVGSEKNNPETKIGLADVSLALMDTHDIDGYLKRMETYTREFHNDVPEYQAPGQQKRHDLLMNTFALWARWHMSRFGSTVKQLASICAKNYFHGSLNPMARYRSFLTAEDVMQEDPMFYPLTKSMCTTEGDGAAAVIVCSGGYLKKISSRPCVKLLASVVGSGRERDIDDESMGERLSKVAYNMAGVGPSDIDLAELHDATSYGELHQTEAMGFCPIGEGGLYAESGATRLGGEKPINTSGGLECRSNPIGATGLAQIAELCSQLRGMACNRQVENARIALAENDGGMIGVEEASMCIHILEKVS
ncbi:MAG: thiolase family protein [Proteobacteria bacterium]|nr:thiolase family protein [Pseudomonadota bacterium]